MESLQLSQVLADLSNLGAAEQQSATAIVTANNSVLQSEVMRSEQVSSKPPRPTSMQRNWSSDAIAQPKYDKYGRRIFAGTPGSRTPTGSIPGTPRGEFDDDLERASTLMALYDIRSKLKQQDNSGLLKAREKINALAAKQQAQQAAEQTKKTAEELRKNRYSFPKPGL